MLILLYPAPDRKLHTVLIQRPVYEGVHSAQIAFPGGRRERTDRNLEETALREAEEEVGVDPGRVEMLGKLSEVYIPPSDHIVSPYLAFFPEPPSLRPEPAEVDAILEAPLEFFLGAERIVERRVRAGWNGVILKVPAYEWEGRTIWGATGMMLSELCMCLEEE